MSSNFQVDVLPKHVCIIMDGNRRWAKKNKLQVFKGHEKVAFEMLDRLIDHSLERGIEYLTLWAFSTENWKRDDREVAALMNLFRKMFERNLSELTQKGVRFETIGDLTRFDSDIQKGLEKMKQTSRDNDKITVTMALNYGGHDELLRAQRKMILDILSRYGKDVAVMDRDQLKSLLEKEVVGEKLEGYLDTADLIKPDLIIRTGGERRLSGFMSWQSAYAELYFTPILMPDFNEGAFDQALLDFDQRQRRFGA